MVGRAPVPSFLGPAVQRIAQFVEGLGPDRGLLSPHHCESERPVELRQDFRPESSDLAFAQAEPNHPLTVFDFVIQRDDVAQQADGAGQAVQLGPDAAWNGVGELERQ
jgi:hypothetical protein